MKYLLIVAAWLAYLPLASAAPSLVGGTGLINTETADVLRSGQMSFGVDSVHEGLMENFVIGVGENLEFGLTNIKYHGHSQQTFVQAKYALIPEEIFTPGISIGLEGAFQQNHRTKYIVMSKTLPFGFRLHVGTGDGRYNGSFGALEASLNPWTTVIGEYDGKTMNYGLRLAIAPSLKLEGGLRGHHTYYGINFTR
ncbi:MAG: YjbH domain-containing protein [Sporomusaceae bacterium]|nr:YjbH domain-containing protein [Sporomusaceae bacterium]